jgi:predicted DNA-binding transcriptional regulator AlpA
MEMSRETGGLGTGKGIKPTGRMLRPSEVVERTGLSRSQIYAMISEQRFPPFVKLSERRSGLPEAWLEAFIAAKAADAMTKTYNSKNIQEVVR